MWWPSSPLTRHNRQGFGRSPWIFPTDFLLSSIAVSLWRKPFPNGRTCRRYDGGEGIAAAAKKARKRRFQRVALPHQPAASLSAQKPLILLGRNGHAGDRAHVKKENPAAWGERG